MPETFSNNYSKIFANAFIYLCLPAEANFLRKYMKITILIITFFLLVLFELIYFSLAKRFNIIDQPNHRSSHQLVTLRGGGIIFSISLLCYPLYFGFEYGYFLIGLLGISIISFIDDIKPVSNKVRLVIHTTSAAFMFYQLDLYSIPFYLIILALFLVIGSINAINFMDGINGITGAYSLITLCTFLVINQYIITFTLPGFLVTAIISVVVFNFFNFRKKAKCFAGDVGSVSIAFIILFFLFQLILKTENFKYLLLLLVYGLDTVTTIVFRMIRKENIGDAHRSHFYQYLANEKKMPHLLVSSIYSLSQLLINLIIILFIPDSMFILILSLLTSAVMFIILRFSLEGSSRLLNN